LPDHSNCHGSNPWLLVQGDKSSAHERAVGRPGGDSLLSHSTHSANSCLNLPKALPYWSRQFLSMTASKLLGPVLPHICRASVSRSSVVQSVGINNSTSS
jgi:hypothetical protein